MADEPTLGAPLVRLARRCLTHRRTALAVLLLVVAVAASGLARLGIRTDAHSLLETRDPRLVDDAAIRAHFAVDDPVLLAVHTASGSIYRRDVLRLLAELTAAVEALDGVRPGSVVSLATESLARADGGSLIFPGLLDDIDSESGVDTVRDYVRELGIYDGTLVSFDESAAAILFYLEPAPGARGAVIDDLRRLMDDAGAAARGDGIELALAGVPVAEALLGEHIAVDFLRFFPLGVLALCLVVWLAFGRWQLLALSAVNVAAVNLFVFGLLGHTVGFLEITTSVLPAFMAFVAVVDDIHIFNRLRATPGATVDALPRVLHELATPLLLTSVTTCVGFSTFALSSIAAVRNFGLFAAVGTLFALVWSFTFTPILLSWLPAAAPAARQRPLGRQLVDHLLAGLERIAASRRLHAVLAVAVITLLAGAARLEVQDGWEQGFAPDSDAAREFRTVGSLFSGSHVLYVEVRRPGAERPFGTPEAFARMAELEAAIARLDGVGGVAGLHRYLTAVADARGMPEAAARPRGGDLERLVTALDLALGRTRREQIVDQDLDATLITVFLDRSDYRNADRVMAAIEARAPELAADGYELALAGGVAVGRVVIGELVRSLVLAATLAPLLCALILTIAYRSWRAGVLVCLPTLVTVGCVLGAMGWLGVPLGVATAVYLAVTLGVGVDFAVHLLDALRGASDEALEAADGTTASRRLDGVAAAIVIDTLAVVACVLVLTVSSVPATYRLGWLVGLSITCSSLLTLTWALNRARARRHG